MRHSTNSGWVNADSVQSIALKITYLMSTKSSRIASAPRLRSFLNVTGASCRCIHGRGPTSMQLLQGIAISASRRSCQECAQQQQQFPNWCRVPLSKARRGETPPLHPTRENPRHTMVLYLRLVSLRRYWSQIEVKLQSASFGLLMRWESLVWPCIPPLIGKRYTCN